MVTYHSDILEARLRRLSGGGHGDDLLYLFLFWIAAYVAAVLAQLTRLSPLLFYLLFGAIFINCHIIEDTPFLTMLAEVAITIVFFALGFEENVAHFLGGIRKAWGIASIGAIVPFLCGFGCSQIFWPDMGIKPALMCGLAVTATAVSLTMITLKSEGLAVSKAAIGIMTSAVLDDVAALCLVAVMVPIATGEAEPTVAGIGWIFGKTIIFFLIIIVFNVVVFPHDLTAMPIIQHIPFLRSIGVHQLLRFHSGEQAVLASLIVGLGTGLLAQVFGFHPAIGAYMGGLILNEKYFDLAPPDAKDIPDDATEVQVGNVYHHVNEILENIAFCWLGPLFFIHLGAQIEIDVDVIKNVVTESLTIFICLFFGQILSASIAARYVPGGFTWTESWMIGFGMLGRAELFFVVLNICYIDNSIFSTEMFFSLTFAAMLLNISVPVTISLYKPYYTGEKILCGGCLEGASPTSKDEPMPLATFGWIHRRARKSEMQRQRRIFQVHGMELDPALNDAPGYTEVVQRIYRFEGDEGEFRREVTPHGQTSKESYGNVPPHQTSKDSYVKPLSPQAPSTELVGPGSQISKDSFGERRISTDSYPKLVKATGCGVKGCNRKTCLVCKRIDAMLAEAVVRDTEAHDRFVKLAYQDEKEDLAAMDHGVHQQVPRTLSEPEYLHTHAGISPTKADNIPRDLSSASLSGATGHELAKEVRHKLEKHDPEAVERRKSGVGHARVGEVAGGNATSTESVTI